MSAKISKTDSLRVNGSSLFFWGSNLSESEKIEILDWYESLPEKEREFVMTIRHEGYCDGDFASNFECEK